VSFRINNALAEGLVDEISKFPQEMVLIEKPLNVLLSEEATDGVEEGSVLLDSFLVVASALFWGSTRQKASHVLEDPAEAAVDLHVLVVEDEVEMVPYIFIVVPTVALLLT
jgi:hypothetical protein